MHEASLAQKLLEQVVCIQREHPLSQVAEVEIELGPLSGVEPLLLSLAFERLVADAGLEEMVLIMEEVELLAICQDCNRQFVINDFEFVCSHCRSTNLEICQGDGVRLMSVSLKPIVLDESTSCSQKTSE